MKKDIATTAHGIARVKKFTKDQDPQTDKPFEVIERRFQLNRKQIEEIRTGRAQAILTKDRFYVKNKKTDELI